MASGPRFEFQRLCPNTGLRMGFLRTPKGQGDPVITSAPPLSRLLGMTSYSRPILDEKGKIVAQPIETSPIFDTTGDVYWSIIPDVAGRYEYEYFSYVNGYHKATDYFVAVHRFEHGIGTNGRDAMIAISTDDKNVLANPAPTLTPLSTSRVVQLACQHSILIELVAGLAGLPVESVAAQLQTIESVFSLAKVTPTVAGQDAAGTTLPGQGWVAS